MAHSKHFSQGKKWGVHPATWAQRLCDVRRMETLEILTDIEQVSQLFSSLEEVRCGQVVAFSDAFGDL